jgi:hypothetical protein
MSEDGKKMIVLSIDKTMKESLRKEINPEVAECLRKLKKWRKESSCSRITF